MEQIWSLFVILSEDQKRELIQLTKKGNNAADKLIYLLLFEKETDEKTLLKKLKISAASFSKIQTQAKDTVVDFIKQKVKSPLADVQLLQQLILKGEVKTAKKFYTALEKTMLEKQDWQMLDFVYHEGFRLAQMNGDLKYLEEVTTKRSSNIQLYAAYIKLYGEVMLEMVRSEKFEERKQDVELFIKRVIDLNQQAYHLGHHALIHNTLLILYHQYSRHFNEPNKTWEIIQKIKANHEQFQHAMNPVTDVIVRISVLNFLCIYESFGSPEPLIADTWKRIDSGGVLAKTNLIYALLGFFLCEQNTKAVHKYLDELEKIQDKTHFASFKSIVLAILCYIEKNFSGFTLHLNLFYSYPNHTQLPDSEVIVRILELLVLKQEMRKHDPVKLLADETHYHSKADALRVYFDRNLNKVRYAEEHDVLNFLLTPSEKNRQKIQSLQNSSYRNSRLLSKFILEVF